MSERREAIIKVLDECDAWEQVASCAIQWLRYHVVEYRKDGYPRKGHADTVLLLRLNEALGGAWYITDPKSGVFDTKTKEASK